MTDIEKNIETNGFAAAVTDGDSMEPMLRSGDTVIIKKPVFPLKKYDIPVYHRWEHLTMHRIVRVSRKGYVICGDNRSVPEKDITDKDIIGVLDGFCRNGEYIGTDNKNYIKYSKRIVRMYYIKQFKNYVYRAKVKIKSIGGKIT